MTPELPFPGHSAPGAYLETSRVGEVLRRLGRRAGVRGHPLVPGPRDGKTALAYEAVARGARASGGSWAFNEEHGAELLEESGPALGCDPPKVPAKPVVACFEAALAKITRRGQVGMARRDDGTTCAGAPRSPLLLVNLAKTPLAVEYCSSVCRSWKQNDSPPALGRFANELGSREVEAKSAAGFRLLHHGRARRRGPGPVREEGLSRHGDGTGGSPRQIMPRGRGASYPGRWRIAVKLEHVQLEPRSSGA